VSSYRAAVDIMTNPGASKANVFSIPGIRDTQITDYALLATKSTARSLYIMDIPAYTDTGTRIFTTTTLPDVNYTIRQFAGRNVNNSYGATYFPDVSIADDGVANKKVRVPASVVALGALAQNDAKSYPWYAPAGFNRTSLSSVANLAVRLTSADRDNLYDSRINPITAFPGLGYVIFGQKTLQIARTALDRVNVRRLMIELARIVTAIGLQFVFEPNTPATRSRFKNLITPQLATVQANSGIDGFKIIMDESNNTQQDIESNRLNGKIIVIPTKAVEYIAIDFIITNAGVQFV
jgi:phage tail sheath protein FI